MTPSRWLWGAAGVAAMFALSPAAALAQAQSPGPTWQIQDVIAEPTGLTVFNAVVAVNSTDAWAAGQNGESAFIEQWNGESWVAMTPPASQINLSASYATAIGASSPRNVWIVGSSGSGYALRWDGASWTKFSFHRYLNMTGTAVFSAKDVWAFGETGSYQPFVRRFNGRGWQSIATPAVPYATSALSSKDIWAAGPTLSTAQELPGTYENLLMHWTGKAWHSVLMPRLGLPGREHLIVNGVLALGPRDVWVAAEITDSNRDDLRAELLNWNGKVWRAFRSPVNGLGSLASGGNGGLWLVAGTYMHNSDFFVHFRNGHWAYEAAPTTEPVPPGEVIDLGAIACVPGSASLLAVGGLGSPSTGLDAVVYDYGS
jgi:hypothetical protein